MLLNDINEIKDVINSWKNDLFYGDFVNNFTDLSITDEVSSTKVSAVVGGLGFGVAIFGFLIVYFLIENSEKNESYKQAIFGGISVVLIILLFVVNAINSNGTEEEAFLDNMTDEQVITLYNSIVSVKLLEDDLSKEDNTKGLINLYQLTSDKNSSDYFFYDKQNTQDEYINYVLNTKNLNNFNKEI